jgi:hypothetical protein
LSERKLAHIELIEKLEPIPNSDFLEKATILGWECVVKKDQFKVGERVCYIETDSIVPTIPFFFFMEPRRYRVKIIRLRKQISQGLAISFSDIDKICSELYNNTMGIVTSSLNIGEDISKTLHIIKHDPQAKEEFLIEDSKKANPIHKYLLKYKWYRAIQPKKQGRWPKWIQKTDEERIQNIPSILIHHADTKVYWSEKLDGKSISISYKKLKVFGIFSNWIFTVCSRNIWLKRPSTQDYWRIVRQLDLQNKLKNYNRELVLQGELCGPRIQKNKYNLKDIDLFIFTVYDIKLDTYLGIEGIRKVCEDLNLKMVPILGTGILKENFPDVPKCVEKSKGTSILASVKREGIVVRQYNNSKGTKGLSFKVISPEFLLGLSEDE